MARFNVKVLGGEQFSEFEASKLPVGVILPFDVYCQDKNDTSVLFSKGSVYSVFPKKTWCVATKLTTFMSSCLTYLTIHSLISFFPPSNAPQVLSWRIRFSSKNFLNRKRTFLLLISLFCCPAPK